MSRIITWRFASATLALVAVSCFASHTQAEQSVTTGDGLLSLKANMPEEVRVGEEFTYDVKVTNTSDNVTLHDIELKMTKAKGFTVDSTSTQSDDAQTEKDGENGNGNGGNGNDSAVENGSGNGDMKIAVLQPGESVTINVKASADEEGELKSCLAIVNYTPAICLTSRVIKPELELTKTAPEQVDRCSVIELQYVVKNSGSGNVGPFVVTDKLGNGITTVEGNEELKFDVDGLAAGDSRQFVARVYASEAGSFGSRAIAKAEDSELKSRSNETTTNVIAADLAVRVEGPNRLYGEQLAKFTAYVANTGNAAADDVLVNVYWPEACNLVDISDPKIQSSDQFSDKVTEQQQDEPTVAESTGDDDNQSASPNDEGSSDECSDDAGSSDGASKDGESSEDQSDNNGEVAMSDKEVTIGRLEAGQMAVIEYAVRTGKVDSLPTRIVARHICNIDAGEDQSAAQSETVASANVRTEVVRLPATQLIVFDDEDPVFSDSNVVYTIRVWNEGDADDSEVRLKAEIPEGLEFVSAKGPTEHSVDGSTIAFEPIETLSAGDRADYKITAKSIGDGDVRFTAILNSESLTQSVTAEEPTRLFAQEAE